MVKSLHAALGMTVMLLTATLVPQGKMRAITVNRISFAYMDSGSGSPVILVHGAMADCREWSNQQEPLSRHHRVIAYSRRYHWPNTLPDKDSDATVERQTEDLAAIIQSLGLQPAHIVGHSYGGLVALTLSLRHPEMVRSLVLVEPAVSSVLESSADSSSLVKERQAFSDEMRKAFDSEDAERIVRAALSHYAPGEFDSASPATRKMYLANIPAFRLDFNSPRPPLICEDMQKIATPALVLAGGRSPKGLQGTAERVAQCLKDGVLLRIPEGTHHMQIDHSQGFNNAVLAFLENIDSESEASDSRCRLTGHNTLIIACHHMAFQKGPTSRSVLD